jgi:hypothetical protein
MDFNELFMSPATMEDLQTGRNRQTDGHRTGRRYAVNRARIVRPRLDI